MPELMRRGNFSIRSLAAIVVRGTFAALFVSVQWSQNTKCSPLRLAIHPERERESLLPLFRVEEVRGCRFGRIDPHGHKMRMRRCPELCLVSALKITIDDDCFTLCRCAP